MTPTEQTRIDFEIKRMERAELEFLLRYHGLLHNKQLTTAIEAYAVAKARAAVAIVHQVQAEKG